MSGDPVDRISVDDGTCALTSFDQLIQAILADLATISDKDICELSVADFEHIQISSCKLKSLTDSKDAFHQILSQRSEQIFRFLLAAYRHRTPSLHAARYPEAFRKALTETMKLNTDPILRLTLRSAEFAQLLLQEQLQSAEDAFPLTVLLCQVMSAVVKSGGPDKVRWWMTVNDHGELLLIRQILQCIGHLLPEVGHPVIMKLDKQSMDVYSYMLNSVCSVIPSFQEHDMNACVRSLQTALRSIASPLVPLFASDVLKFISKIASSSFTFSLFLNALDAWSCWLQTETGHCEIIRMTCCRLAEELSQHEKVWLAERLPVRRHFFFWSQLPPCIFLDLSLIVAEMYNECMVVLRETVDGPAKSTVALTCRLCRLPLSLLCLRGLLTLTEGQRKDVPDMKTFTKDVGDLLIQLWILLSSVPAAEAELDLVNTSLCLLLQLGSLLPPDALPDKNLTIVLEGINSSSPEKPWIVPPAAKFLASLAKRKKISGVLMDLILAFFSTWCGSTNVKAKNAALSWFYKFAMWTRCEERICRAFTGDAAPGLAESMVKFCAPTNWSSEEVTDLLRIFQAKNYTLALSESPVDVPVPLASEMTVDKDEPGFELAF